LWFLPVGDFVGGVKKTVEGEKVVADGTIADEPKVSPVV
jgi:hypothetical protein